MEHDRLRTVSGVNSNKEISIGQALPPVLKDDVLND